MNNYGTLGETIQLKILGQEARTNAAIMQISIT